MWLYYQAVEGARIAGASKIIGVDLNPDRYKEGNHDSREYNMPSIKKLVLKKQKKLVI